MVSARISTYEVFKGSIPSFETIRESFDTFADSKPGTRFVLDTCAFKPPMLLGLTYYRDLPDYNCDIINEYHAIMSSIPEEWTKEKRRDIIEEIEDFYTSYLYAVTLFIQNSPVFVIEDVISELSRGHKRYRNYKKTLRHSNRKSDISGNIIPIISFEENYFKRILTSPDSLLQTLEGKDRVWRIDESDEVFTILFNYIMKHRNEWLGSNIKEHDTEHVDERLLAYTLSRIGKDRQPHKILSYDTHIIHELKGFIDHLRSGPLSADLRKTQMPGYVLDNIFETKFGVYHMNNEGHIEKRASYPR